jgi:hypothetical protein
MSATPLTCRNRLPARLPIADSNFLPSRQEPNQPHIDFAEPSCDRPHARLNSGRQRPSHLGEALADLLARKVYIGPIGEHGGDLRKAVARQRSGVFKSRNSGERGFNRERDLFLDLGRGQGRRNGIDLNLVVRDVGNGVDWQPDEGPDAPSGRHCRQQYNKPSLPDGKCKDALNHQ